MNIEIIKPVFKCTTDEEIFFQRITGIDGFRLVTANEKCLQVSVAESDKQVALDQIATICTLWNASFTVTS